MVKVGIEKNREKKGEFPRNSKQSRAGSQARSGIRGSARWWGSDLLPRIHPPVLPAGILDFSLAGILQDSRGSCSSFPCDKSSLRGPAEAAGKGEFSRRGGGAREEPGFKSQRIPDELLQRSSESALWDKEILGIVSSPFPNGIERIWWF